MSPADRELAADVLRACFEAVPLPLYPGTFTEERGFDRAALDRVLDELRIKGLVRLPEWTQGRGQGYTLTEAGLDLMRSPRGLRRGAPIPTARLPVPGPDVEPSPPPLVRPGPPRVCYAMIAIN